MYEINRNIALSRQRNSTMGLGTQGERLREREREREMITKDLDVLLVWFEKKYHHDSLYHLQNTKETF